MDSNQNCLSLTLNKNKEVKVNDKQQNQENNKEDEQSNNNDKKKGSKRIGKEHKENKD